MIVWLFGTMASPGVATFALRQCARDHADMFCAETRDTEEESSYVDESLGKKLVRELPEMLSKGGFWLTKWTCYSAEVLRSIPEEERTGAVKLVEGRVEGVNLTLGMKLDFGRDRFMPAFDEELLDRKVS